MHVREKMYLPMFFLRLSNAIIPKVSRAKQRSIAMRANPLVSGAMSWKKFH
jgi:hypothetical protein